LTVIVGVDLMEDCIGLIHVDAWCSFWGDFDGRGGGDEGDKGEFHFDLVLFFIILWLKHGL
jgi:hypothetical protein